MRSRVGGGVAWLRRLWRGAGAEAEPASGSDVLLSIDDALGALEALVCEGFVHASGAPASAELSSRMRAGGPVPRNAFGRTIREEAGRGAAGSVAMACGMALGGLRATSFLTAEDLIEAEAELAGTASRLAPLVLHVALEGGHGAWHRTSGNGWVQVLAGTTQEALDLSLLLRWLTERALVPGLLATDRCQVERVWLPDAGTVRAFLGAPEEAIAAPTEAQRLLFGEERERVLRWFDPDRPVATGGLRSLGDRAAVAQGRTLFFRDHVRELAQQGMQELGQLTGRPLSFVTRYRLDDAERVLVLQGSAVRTACAVADRLRARRIKVGVLGVSWLRPFPAAEVAAALGQARAIAVVEPLSDPVASEAPLAREIANVLPDGARTPISAICAVPGPRAADLSALCDLLGRPAAPREIRLDRVRLPAASGFPRRDALLEAVANAYPELGGDGPSGADAPSPGSLPSVGLVGYESELPPDAPSRLAQALTAKGSAIRGEVRRPQPHVQETRVYAAAADFPEPLLPETVDLLWIASAQLGELGRPLQRVSRGGTVLIAGRLPPEDAWARLPGVWQRDARDRELRLRSVDEGFEAGLAVVGAFLAGETGALEESGAIREIDGGARAEQAPGEPELPGIVRRVERARASFDSVPRFWGERVQPEICGAPVGFPDPLATSEAVPAGASALQPGSSALTLPVLDPDRCTGCSRCWSACPDAAIGVSVLGPEPLLTAASQLAGTEGRAADALRRAHRNLASRLAGQLTRGETGRLQPEICREAWGWLAERMDISEEDRPEYEAAFEATLDTMTRLDAVITETFFRGPEGDKKAEGELLLLTIDPRACVGCGLCVAVCPEDALTATERTPERVAEHRERWRLWEGLPDTRGATLARAAESADVGPLGAILLSRHCAQAQTGSGQGEPGSGERLAGRLVTSLVEHHAQRHLAELVKGLGEQRDALEAKLREDLAEALAGADTATLSRALEGAGGGRANLTELGARLEAIGTHADFDRRRALRLARLCGELERTRQRLAVGEDGLGRARFGVIVTPGSVAEWAARYPLHPWYAPLTLAPTAEGVELARGIAHGLVADHVHLIRMLRRAALEAEAPADRTARLDAIESLGWEELSADERAACPPLLLFGDDGALVETGLDGMMRLLGSDLPVKVVLLDGRGALDARPEPALVAMAHRRAFVLSGSLAHTDHLVSGLADALAWPGPALIQLHAPSPWRHGFPAEQTLERARLAVESRAHVLFRYDPGGEGLFGLRASLEGNPALDQDWGELSFPEWAKGESRFARELQGPAEGAVELASWLALPEEERGARRARIEIEGEEHVLGPSLARATAERLAVWTTLRELTGAVSPFTERIRAEIARELETDKGREVAALEARHAEDLERVRAGVDQQALARLTDRLMALAGYGKTSPGAAPRGNGE